MGKAIVGKQTGRRSSIGLSLLKSLFIAYLVTGVILLLLAFLMYKVDPPDMAISAGIIFSYIFSSFLGGLIVGKSTGSKKYLWGLLTGVLYFAVIFAVSTLLNKDVLSQLGNTITVFIMCSMGGMLGGMIS